MTHAVHGFPREKKAGAHVPVRSLIKRPFPSLRLLGGRQAVRELSRLLDVDGNGVVDRDEFLAWTKDLVRFAARCCWGRSFICMWRRGQRSWRTTSTRLHRHACALCGADCRARDPTL